MFKEELEFVKKEEYIVNSKFYVNVHLPLGSLPDGYNDLDLVFFADAGTIVYKEHIQDKIESIRINKEMKTCYITWK